MRLTLSCMLCYTTMLVLLVYRVVSQMYESVFLTAYPIRGGSWILSCCKAHQPFIVHVDAQWANRSDSDIDSQVKLKFVDCKGVRNVVTHDCWLILRDISWLVSNEDTLTLCHVRWLTDPVLIRSVIHVGMQLICLFGQNVSSWPKIEVMLTMSVLHAMDSICEEILPSEFYAPREMIHLLILAHCLVEAIFERLGSPHDQPVVSDWPSLVGKELVFVDLLKLAQPVVLERVLYQLYF